MAVFVGFPVEAEGLLTVRFVGDDSLGSAVFQPLPQRCTVIGFVAKKFFGNLGATDKAWGRRTVMRLTTAQKDGKKTAFSICDCVDFRIAPASRAANRLLLFPLFAPDAERCALM